MGRRARHSARTGNGGAELRARKRQLQDAEREQRSAELAFLDDPSDKDIDSERADSGGSDEEEEEEQEVLGLGGGSEDDEEEDSEAEEEAEEEELDVDNDVDNDVDGFDADEERKKIMKMDGKWGKSRKNFYSADTAEFELESDEEAAKDEEEAALELQRKQAAMMDDEDFGFDNKQQEADEESEEGEVEATEPVDDEDLIGEQLADIATLADDGFGASGASVELVQRDFSKLSKKDKLQIVNQAAPELLGLMGELESTMKDLNEVVTPAIQKLKGMRRRSAAYNRGLQYLVTRQNLLLNYSANISFYLLLRAEGKSVKDHPVLMHLLSLKKQMNKLEPLDEALEDQLRDLLEKQFPFEEDEQVEDGMDQFFKQQKQQKPAKRASSGAESVTASSKKRKPSVSDAERAEADKFYEEAARSREALTQAKKEFYSHDKPGLGESSGEDSDAEGGKRGASYQIMKNKGLTAHKSKLNRNPRVKKRMQYRKAVIRRKGQVRDVRVGEAGKYGGETTGIKSNLSRSRKIRN